MTEREKSWPQCITPQCQAQADCGLTLQGGFGEVSGMFCHKHAQRLRALLPSDAVWQQLLHAVTLSALELTEDESPNDTQ